MVLDTSIMCHLINKVLQFDHLVFIVQLVANISWRPISQTDNYVSHMFLFLVYIR